MCKSTSFQISARGVRACACVCVRVFIIGPTVPIGRETTSARIIFPAYNSPIKIMSHI